MKRTLTPQRPDPGRVQVAQVLYLRGIYRALVVLAVAAVVLVGYLIGGVIL